MQVLNWSFSYADFLVLVLVSYAFFAPMMYLHMLKQRRSKLSAPRPASGSEGASKEKKRS